jgi:hypothetical protein
MVRRAAVLTVALAGLLTAPAGAQVPPVPIPSIGLPPSVSYQGSPAAPAPIPGLPPIPHNPFMAPNGKSEIHDDGWQTDASAWGGPLGRSPHTTSSFILRDCGSLTFDSQGRLLSVCIGTTGPELYMFDPTTLATLATFALPLRQGLSTNFFQDFTGGGYFYLDNHDRVIAGTTTRHIYVIAEDPGSPGFALAHDYDLSSVLNASEKITSALPDSHGLLWFVARNDGVVGTLNFSTGRIHAIHLGNGAVGEIENSFATDIHGGVYIATNRRLYRFAAGAGGAPKIVWQVTYPNSFEHKSGQVDDGTGTTPTVMAGGYVNITDNADPMDVVVYRTAPRPHRFVRRHHHRRRVRLPRLLCKVPIFARGQSADENSLISVGRSMIAEDNYGYSSPTSLAGRVTTPGFARVDINRNGRGCHTVWTNTSVSAPTVVSKLAIANGLIYTYTTDPAGNWYWTALDFRTGRTVYRSYAGSGPLYNNNYAGIAISPTGTEYLGTLGGIVSMRDGS